MVRPAGLSRVPSHQCRQPGVGELLPIPTGGESIPGLEVGEEMTEVILFHQMVVYNHFSELQPGALVKNTSSPDPS